MGDDAKKSDVLGDIPKNTAENRTEEELKGLENEVVQAMLRADMPALDRIFSDDWIMVDEEAQVRDKKAEFEPYKTGEEKVTAGRLDDMRVRLFGESAAVTGRYMFKGSFQGKRFDIKGRFTDVWVRRNGRWQIVSSQNTAIPEAAAAQLGTSAEGFVTTEDQVRLAYRVLGNGAEVLVIPGGYSSMGTDFSSLSRGRKLIVYDQRSRGHSDAVKDSSHLGMDYEVRDLESVRQYFHVERMSLLGCSYLGGMIVLYALAHPEHVERLIQVDPIPSYRELYTRAEDTLNSRLDKAAVDRLEQMRKAGLDRSDAVQFCREADKVFNPPYFGDPDAAAKYHTDCELKNEQVNNADRTWNAIELSLGNWDWHSRLKSIKSPTLVMYGTRDWIPESAAREWAATLPKARLLLLPGAGHISWFEQSDLVFSAVDSFLTGSWPEGTSGSSRVELPTGKDPVETVHNPHDEEAGQKGRDAEKELIQLEKDFAEATLKHDREFYDRILADDWINVHEDGSVGTKRGDAAHKSEYDTATFDDIKVRVYGESAVAVGRYSIGWTEGGRRSAVSGRFTDVWVRRNGRWQIISSQNTAIPEARATEFPPDSFFIAMEKEDWEALKHQG